jgi:hydroxylamine reductase
MFCYQCEQTAKGTGCTIAGVCGKDAHTAVMQDLLVHAVKGVSMYASRLRSLGVADPEADEFVVKALFTTVTNVNFDAGRITEMVSEAVEIRDRLRDLYLDKCAERGAEPETLAGPAVMELPMDGGELAVCAETLSIQKRIDTRGEDITGLEELVTYGLKGMAAYADHAQILGVSDEGVYAFFHEALDFLTLENPVSALLEMALRVGEQNLRVMELLDKANTGTYGHPEPTRVRISPVKGKAILVSGHDLRDLSDLLEQTAGKGINVYTHGEMLPALAYPGLKKHSHLVGNYGGAWQDQQKEFDEFPGAILMTTNCIQKPRDSYMERIFTTGLVRWPGTTHIPDRDYSQVIEKALAEEGFPADGPEEYITVGFGRNAVMSVAGTVIEAVKSGAVRHFFLVGGCDGARSGRNYYTELAGKIPEDCVILTLACGKYRFNKMDFGEPYRSPWSLRLRSIPGSTTCRLH